MTRGPLQQVTGVILAGGQARRMNGEDKGLIPLGPQPMVQYVLQVLRPQVADIIISANRNLDRYGAFGYRVVSDVMGDYSGPLAGIASAMGEADTPYLVCAPCDSPLVTLDLVARLHGALEQARAEIAVAHDGERLQPVFALMATDLLPDLNAYLQGGGRKIDRWYAEHRLALADFSDSRDTFLNVNSFDERDALWARLQQHTGGTPHERPRHSNTA